MSEHVYYYSLIRYVPKPERGEFVNVGVLALSSEGSDTSVQFSDDWRRVRALGSASDVRLLQQLSRSWGRGFRSTTELGKLFAEGPPNLEWLQRVHGEAANVIQISEPRRSFATGAAELAREVYDELVAVPRASTRRAVSRRPLQLEFEGHLRRRGLESSWERNFDAPGAEIADWRFDYALRNGTPFHLVQTLNLKLEDVHAILADATYVAYAKRDLGGTPVLGNVPVTVIAEPPDEETVEVAEEARTILDRDDVALVMRDDVSELVDRLAVVAGLNPDPKT